MARKLTTSVLVAAALLLAGCATDNSLYNWGNYPSQQYSYLNGDHPSSDSINELEEAIQEAAGKGKPVPPGLQAHLGLLYAQAGQHDKFVQYLEAEKKQYPESKEFVNFLLNHKPAQGKKK